MVQSKWYRGVARLLHWCSLLLMVSSLAKSASLVAIDQKTLEHTDLGRDNHSQLFWPAKDERKVNPLFTEEDRRILVKKMSTLKVISLEEGCGRMKNRLATLEDGTRVCCRYRDNSHLLRGDVFSYHFSRLLGMWNVPTTAAMKVDLSSRQWSSVREKAAEAGWKNGASIAISQFVDELKEEYFPSVLKNLSSPPLTESRVANSPESEKKQLVEWTDMIVFDFIIGHNDRLFNALLNSKWNSHMMEKPVHNLKKTASTSDLVLLDNESGFDFGYVAAKQKEEYYGLQIAFLERICVFREQTIRALIALDSTDTGGIPSSTTLENYIQQVDLHSYSALTKWRTQSKTEFDARVKETLKRIHKCIQ